MFKFICFIMFMCSITVFSGCVTNSIIDVNKRNLTDELVDKTDSLTEKVSEAEAEKRQAIESLRQSLSKIQQDLERETGEKNILLTQTEEGIKLTILDTVIFTPGSAEVNKKGKHLLIKVSNVVKGLNKEILIAGHTDNQPIKKAKKFYKSNWELSFSRAINVLHVFENAGVNPEDMTALGYGDIKPIVSNETIKGRRQNRRVEIIISNTIKRLNDSAEELIK
jgi:chemotaxis protein MotB